MAEIAATTGLEAASPESAVESPAHSPQLELVPADLVRFTRRNCVTTTKRRKEAVWAWANRGWRRAGI